MSDADRLRAAADRLEWDASYMQPGDFPELQQERQAKTATATLLRAVADTAEPHQSSLITRGVVRHNRAIHEDEAYCDECSWSWPCDVGLITTTALALAAVILGGDQ